MVWVRRAGIGALAACIVSVVAVGVPWLAAAMVLLFLTLWSDRAAAEDREPAIARDAQAILDASPDACVVLRSDGTIVWANNAAREAFGIFQAGNPFSFTVRVPELINAVERVARTGRAEQVRWSERVPTSRWYQAFVRTFTLASGALHPRNAVVIFVRDLTERERLDRMREDFVANASHELRTPLAALTGFIETLQGPAREDAKARDQFLNIMREQAERMRRLTDALLSLSRIEMRVHVRPTELVDCAKTAAYASEMARNMADEHGVALEVETPSSPITVRGDGDELVQVADNLIENAIKYGGSGGRVIVRAEVDQDTQEGIFSVQDFGAGIAPEHVPRLTERFYRVEGDEPRVRRGTGLGLAIVKHIVTRHRGRLVVRSQLGAGSTFTVRIPLEPVPDAPTSPKRIATTHA